MAGISRAAPGFLERWVSAGSLLRCDGYSPAAVRMEELDYVRECQEGLQPMAATFEEEPHGMRLVFIGSSATEKQLYALRLAELLDVPCISMASLVQDLHANSRVCKKIGNAVNGGEPIPEKMIPEVLLERLEEGYLRGETGFILDGIPRTWKQAVALDLAQGIDLVVNFKCKDDISSESASNHVWGNKQNNASKLEEYYRAQNKLLDFQVADDPVKTWRRLLAALNLQDIDDSLQD